MSSIDDRLQRVRAFLHFQSLNPDKCHVSPEAEDAIAFAAEIERLCEWQRRACNVLPLIQREAGSDLAREVGWLLQTEDQPAHPDDEATCAKCGALLELVRPGKWQHYGGVECQPDQPEDAAK